MSGRLQGKICVVTAAGQGMGRSSVEAFQREGATVHASDVDEAKLAGLARARGIPFIVDLGSGMLVDLAQYGLPHEPTPQETLARGADIVAIERDGSWHECHKVGRQERPNPRLLPVD